MKSLEVIVRANITVKSSIKNLLLRDASTVVSCRAGVGVGVGVGISSLRCCSPWCLNPLLPRSQWRYTWTLQWWGRRECPGGSSSWRCWLGCWCWRCWSCSLHGPGCFRDKSHAGLVLRDLLV